MLAAIGCLGGLFSPASGGDRSRREPAVSAEAAIKLAKRHLKARDVDVSRHYLDSVHLEASVPPATKAPRWRLTWEMKERAKGGQILVFVSMDKTVEIGFGE